MECISAQLTASQLNNNEIERVKMFSLQLPPEHEQLACDIDFKCDVIGPWRRMSAVAQDALCFHR